MRILVDVDDTVSDFEGSLRQLLECYPELKDRYKADSWDWFRKDHKVEAVCEEALADWGFWRQLPLLSGAGEGIAYLRSQGHELMWCTMPYKKCFGWADARREWLEEKLQINLYKEPLITVSGGEKYLVRATTIIDDKVPFVEAWEKKNNSIGFVIAASTNVGYHQRYTWEDIIKNKFFLRKIL